MSEQIDLQPHEKELFVHNCRVFAQEWYQKREEIFALKTLDEVVEGMDKVYSSMYDEGSTYRIHEYLNKKGEDNVIKEICKKNANYLFDHAVFQRIDEMSLIPINGKQIYTYEVTMIREQIVYYLLKIVQSDYEYYGITKKKYEAFNECLKEFRKKFEKRISRNMNLNLLDKKPQDTSLRDFLRTFQTMSDEEEKELCENIHSFIKNLFGLSDNPLFNFIISCLPDLDLDRSIPKEKYLV